MFTFIIYIYSSVEVLHAPVKRKSRMKMKLLEYTSDRNPEWPITGHILDPVLYLYRYRYKYMCFYINIYIYVCIHVNVYVCIRKHIY